MSIKLPQDRKDEYLSTLIDFLRIPSISALPSKKKYIIKAANFIKEYLIMIGFEKDKVEFLYPKYNQNDAYNPVVYAEKISNKENPTILIYGHYDVQPVDPIEEWKSDPFEPSLADNKIVARGATDDKGQIFTHLAALNEMFVEFGDSHSNWPVNFKLLIEGEEEAGGECISALLNEMPEKFTADVCVVSDTGFIEKGKPTLEYGLKGIAYMQITVSQSKVDLHSGIYGGAVMNPANALVYILSQLYDQKQGRVLIPSFYDRVIDISNNEKEKLSSIPFIEEKFLMDAGESIATFSEVGYTPIEHSSARPTLDINGIIGGFTGEGAKTIIPAKASAKVSMRLVADQIPEEISKLFIEFVESITPKEVKVHVETLHLGNGVLIDLNSQYINKAEEALRKVFGGEVVFTRSGGSIPIVADIYKKLGIDVILLGYGLPDDGLHSPNEKFDLDQFYNGICCNLVFYKSLGK